MKMGHKTSGSNSKAAFKAGESWRRRSVRNQYITRGRPIVILHCLAARTWSEGSIYTYNDNYAVSEPRVTGHEVHDVKIPAMS